MHGTRTLLSLAIGLALAAPAAHAAFSCPADAELTAIPQIQGEGNQSPLATTTTKNGFTSDSTVTVRARVSALGESLNKGFYLLDTNGDDNPATSDGIFVFLNDKAFSTNYPDIQPGAEVCLEAKVVEYYGATQLTPVSDGQGRHIQVIGQGQAPAAIPLRIANGETLRQAMSRHEGMRVTLDAETPLVISRNFGYDYAARRNNLMLSLDAPLIKPTQRYPALSQDALDLAEHNRLNRLFLESDYKAADGVIPWFPALDPDQGYLRLGDTPTGLEAMVGYSFNEYRLIVPKDQTLSASDLRRLPENDRQPAPARATGSDLRVASFNVLNYFTSHSSIGGDLNVLCADQADADSAKGCNRGAKTQAEFEKQSAKIVNAITEMDADLLGLMEMENNGFGEHSAIQTLVTRLNQAQKDSDRHYAFVQLPTTAMTEGKYVGGDAIMVAMLYRPTKLTPQGEAGIIPMPQQRYSVNGVDKQASQRDALRQTFTVAGSDTPLTLIVNHLKSKGSGCYENGDGSSEPADLQGKCTEFRVSAAKVLGDAASELPGQVLLVGDFNSYGAEDPIRVLTDYDPAGSERQIMSASHTFIGDRPYESAGQAITHSYGFIDLNAHANQEKAISYSYEGEQGTLDYALANPVLADKMVSVTDWHINAFESNLFEYGSRYTGNLAKSDNPFSASDHDPIIVDLHLAAKATTDEGGNTGVDTPVEQGSTVDNTTHSGEDGNHATTEQHTEIDEASGNGGGSAGLGLLALLPLAFWRRRR